LMEQVSGRAGRKDKQGRVMIQVAHVSHPVLKFVQQHDYKSFFTFEIDGRQRFAYPPFTRLIMLTFRHKMKDVVLSAANAFADLLKKDFENYIIGPAEPVISRVRNQYLMELLLKLPKDAVLINRVKKSVRHLIAAIHQDRRFRSVVVIADVDPV
ncbi:MAG: primosomal protein N', partial [Chitinophagaceae bacterium]